MNLLMVFALFCTATLADVSDDFFSDNDDEYDTSGSSDKKNDYYDPLEPVNRVTFTVSYVTTKYVFLPIAMLYSSVISQRLQPHIHGVTQNISLLTNIPSTILIPHKSLFIQSVSRFITNSIFGFFGFFDIHSRYDDQVFICGLDCIAQYYSTKPLPYLFLPWAPSNIFGIPDFGLQIYIRKPLPRYFWYVSAGGIVTNMNVNYDNVYDAFYHSIDPYSVTRNVYYSMQQSKVAKIRNSKNQHKEYSDLLPQGF